MLFLQLQYSPNPWTREEKTLDCLVSATEPFPKRTVLVITWEWGAPRFWRDIRL